MIAIICSCAYNFLIWGGSVSTDNLYKDVGGLTAHVQSLLETFRKLSEDLQNLKPVLQEKANKEDLQRLEKHLYDLDREIRILILDASANKSELSETTKKLNKLEIKQWKLAALVTSGGFFGGMISKIVEFLFASE